MDAVSPGRDTPLEISLSSQNEWVGATAICESRATWDNLALAWGADRGAPAAGAPRFIRGDFFDSRWRTVTWYWDEYAPGPLLGKYPAGITAASERWRPDQPDERCVYLRAAGIGAEQAGRAAELVANECRFSSPARASVHRLSAAAANFGWLQYFAYSNQGVKPRVKIVIATTRLRGLERMFPAGIIAINLFARLRLPLGYAGFTITGDGDTSLRLYSRPVRAAQVQPIVRAITRMR